MSTTAQELLAGADTRSALATLEQQVRAKGDDARLRVFLFQLLCITGQWQRALTQLQVCGELDAGTLAMSAMYRDAVQCEAVREAVFAGRTLPQVFGRPQLWVASLAEALQAEGRGEPQAAAALRAQALEAAPATRGSLDGRPFEWIADADSRLGPVLEAVIGGRYGWVPFAALAKVTIEPPADLRDMVWVRAQLEFIHGATPALLPVRYAGSADSGEGALQLARRTDWLELAVDQYRGVGQRVFVTNDGEIGLLDAREIVLVNDAQPLPDGAAA